MRAEPQEVRLVDRIQNLFVADSAVEEDGFELAVSPRTLRREPLQASIGGSGLNL
jgi:hypothetical protein